jgi:hypothetical protein
MFDNIDTFNMNLANQVSLWVALNATRNDIHSNNVTFKGIRKRNPSLFKSHAATIVDNTVSYPFAGEA